MNPFRDALDLRLAPSRRLLFLLSGLHLAAAAVIVAAAWRQPWLLALLAPLAVSLWWQRRRLISAPARIVRIQWRPDGRWRWERADGRAATGALAGTSVSTPAIVLLHLRAEDRRWPRAVAVLPDSVGRRRFRHLRVQLRLHGGGED